MATDAVGDVYVVDYGGHCIKKFTGTGIPLTQWGSLGSGNGQFNSPAGVATDADATETQHFEATDEQPLRAIERVVQQVEAWQGQRR